MRAGMDGMLVVRAELCERLEHLQLLSRSRQGADYSSRVASIRQMAAAYGLTPVARLAEAMERAIAETGPRSCTAGLYVDRLYDAIGCGRTDEAASEALLASVKIQTRM